MTLYCNLDVWACVVPQSSSIYILLLPTLYYSVDLKSSEQCRVTLKMFSKRPDITRHVKKLVVRPNNREWMIAKDRLDELWVVRLIENMAVKHVLVNLTAFTWDGSDIPLDSLWSTLRISCVWDLPWLFTCA